MRGNCLQNIVVEITLDVIRNSTSHAARGQEKRRDVVVGTFRIWFGEDGGLPS